MTRIICFAIAVLLALSTSTFADSDEFKKFKADYKQLNIDLLNTACEVIEVENFVYQKDLATFTFEKGTFYLLRYVNDRPTTAIFSGQGRASISIPSDVERNSLRAVAKDSVVNESFEYCFIRFGDNLDAKLKEQFKAERTKLSWKIYNIAKQGQGEVFFRPVIQHYYDNYFQLLRSCYERADDGFFWIDFNRYVLAFDPNQPEQFRLSYEFQGGDFAITSAAVLQRQETAVYENADMSMIKYPTTSLKRHGKIKMGGSDGTRLEAAESSIKIVINRDSLKYVSLFLHRFLREDSIYYDGAKVDYKRRKDFAFIGLILPEYKYKGDTLNFTLWYHGKNFDNILPYVDNPAASTVSFEFEVRSGSNYYMPGKMATSSSGRKTDSFEAIPDHPYNTFNIQGYVSGTDTVKFNSDIGIQLNLLRLGYINKRNFTCFIPDHTHQGAVVDAFNYMTSKFGSPHATFEIFVSPEDGRGMPGLIFAPQVVCLSEREAFGGIDLIAGNGVAEQWFGGALRPMSDRELWVGTALPKYLSLLFVEHNRNARAYYSNLFNRRDTLLNFIDRRWDKPLATGNRLSATLSSNKGIWLMHMLRILMFDTEKRTTTKFMRFLRELSVVCNNSTFTNSDIIKLAEKHYGGSLSDFFEHWLYDFNIPEFNVEYSFTKKDDGHYISGAVVTKKVGEDFAASVIMRVRLKGDGKDESVYFREIINGPSDTFELGPFSREPKEFKFNEFFSVLSEDKVKKK
ncbi:MAG: hypothetical protein IH931_02015 [candidate division Zixibacteria bacterium]|nr:hypothetical protein [candidate division Zixibacteria bacterium]